MRKMYKDHVKNNVQQQVYEYDADEHESLVYEVEITFYNKDEKAIREFIENKFAEDRKILSISNN